MSERHISEREFAALTFRILGVVILLGGVARALFILPSVAPGDWSTWAMAKLLGFFASLVLLGVVALPLVFLSKKLAAWLFPESEKTVSFAVSGRGLLMCGLALVGAWLLAVNLPYLMSLAVEAVWLAEGSRRSQVEASFWTQAAFDMLGAVFACVAGWVLFRYSGGITDWWESRSRGDS